MDSIKSLFEARDFHWWKVSGLLTGLSICLGFALATQELVGHRYVSIAIWVMASVLWLGFWLYKQRIPRTPKDKIGILICIHSTEQDVDRLVREDFISNLKKSLQKNDDLGNVYISVVPYHVASRVEDMEAAVPLLNKSKGHHLLYGVVKKRDSRHILDLTAYVRHSKLNDESTQRFKSDISSAWISRYNFDNPDKILESFELSSEIVSLCSRYIIGLAAFASSSFIIAEVLFLSVRKSITNNQYPSLPAVKNIRRQVSEKLNTIYLIEAQSYLRLWESNRDPRNLKILSEILGKVFGVYKKSGEYLTANAIVQVALHDNFYLAEKSLKAIKQAHRDAIWNLNYGFLKACEGNERSALEKYKAASSLNQNSDRVMNLQKISEFEEFMHWYMQSHDFPLLLFLSGLLNDEFKGDFVAATANYTAFIKDPRSPKFKQSLSQAEKRIKSLKNE